MVNITQWGISGSHLGYNGFILGKGRAVWLKGFAAIVGQPGANEGHIWLKGCAAFMAEGCYANCEPHL